MVNGAVDALTAEPCSRGRPLLLRGCVMWISLPSVWGPARCSHDLINSGALPWPGITGA